MAKKKFYAVRAGNTTGIFTSWDDCKASVGGYSNPDYKGFVTQEEAEAYLSSEDIYMNQIKEDLANGYIVAYTDGSFDENSNQYAYGVCIFDLECNEIHLNSKVSGTSFASSRNIAGEIYGVLTALDWAVSNGHDKIKIYHDLESISKWATGEYNANSEIAKFYVSKLTDKFNKCINYEFVKVKGHSNNPYNEIADRLAAGALKGERKMIKGANSFTVDNFEKGDLAVILQLIEDNNEGIQIERKDISGGEQIRVKFGKYSTMVKMYNNKLLLVQGKPNLAYQLVFTYISELLGEKEIIPLVKTAYRMKVDVSTIDSNYSNMCPNIPSTYNSNIIKLIRQAIINLGGYFEAEEYGQYAFPALRAMEGHIKYLLGKHRINVGRSFEQFDGSPQIGYRIKSTLTVPPPYDADIEECYTFYARNRHKIVHFGDIIGSADNTFLISTKEDADKIIREAIQLINKSACKGGNLWTAKLITIRFIIYQQAKPTIVLLFAYPTKASLATLMICKIQ